MLTHGLVNSCCDYLVDMKKSYRGKSSLRKNLFNPNETGYSSHSIVQCMENFMEAVREMDDTILVPSRLMDLKVEAAAKPDCKSLSLVHSMDTLPDLFILYTAVRSLKTQLQWGGKEESVLEGSADGAITPATAAGNIYRGGVGPLISAKGHVRRPSTASVSSTNSSATSVISDPDSDGSSIENDSGIDGELEACPKLNTLDIMEQNFQRNLKGLKDTLKQLTEAARYVTRRYQKHVLDVIE